MMDDGWPGGGSMGARSGSMVVCDGFVLIRQFENEKHKLEKRFTKFKIRNHFSTLKKFCWSN
jgi:hypothetical protein